jgi:hypothetical protein
MTCRECRDVMLEVARRRAAPFIERAVRAHTAGCAECGSRLEQETALTAGLRAVAQEVGGSGASPDVEARLMAAFAAEHRRPRHARPWAAVARRWLPRAAAIALCAGLAAWWAGSTAPSSLPAPPVVRVVRPPAPASAPVVTAGHRDEQPDRRVAAPRATRRQTPRPEVDPAVEAVGFVPIPSAAGLPDFESGEIVRLGIPVGSLPNYGLEIPSGSQVSIQADLLIGQDGQARAIRLVNAAVEDPRPRR